MAQPPRPVTTAKWYSTFVLETMARELSKTSLKSKLEILVTVHEPHSITVSNTNAARKSTRNISPNLNDLNMLLKLFCDDSVWKDGNPGYLNGHSGSHDCFPPMVPFFIDDTTNTSTLIHEHE